MNRAQHNTVAEMTDEQLRQHALEILQRELGADGFARFLRVYLAGTGNFTRDRATNYGRHQEAPRKNSVVSSEPT
jgi:hypothetical protein